MPGGDLFGGAHIEHLQGLASVEAIGELLRRQLGKGGVGHGSNVCVRYCSGSVTPNIRATMFCASGKSRRSLNAV